MAMFGGWIGINGDGKVSCAEKVMGYGFSNRPWGRRSRGAGSEYFASRSHSAAASAWTGPVGAEADDEVFTQVERSVNLVISGLDVDELRAMSAWDRWEALEDAGLDPEDYDYLGQ